MTWTPTLAELNELQSNGLISDLCVTWADVAPCDKERVLKLREEREQERPRTESDQ